MTECSFCGEEFDNKTDLHIHWGEQHEDELNSHKEEKVKKAERKKEERKQKKNAERKRMAGMGLAGLGALIVIALLGSQLINTGSGSTADLSIEGEPVKGNPDANITVVEFGDFQCPYCGQFDQSVYPRLVDNYVETGQVKIVWKDYPLTEIGHDWAQPAAEAMECVYREGGNEAFWNVKTKVFDNQDQINLGNAQSKIKSYAAEENVSSEAVQSCLDTQNPGEEVNRDKSQGKSAGVTGTPTVFVNGKEVEARYSSIKAAIEQQLRK